MKRRIAMLLSILMVFSLLTVCDVKHQEKVVEAVTTKTLNKKVGDYIHIKHSLYKTAKYSFSVSKNGYVKFWGQTAEDDGETFSFEALKPGTVTITIRQTYKKKTKKVMVVKVRIKGITDVGIASGADSVPQIYVKKGLEFDYRTLGLVDAGPVESSASLVSSNTSVATTSGWLVKPISTGKTKISVKNNTQNSYVYLNVVNDNITSTNSSWDNAIASLNKATIKSTNIASLYNKEVELENQMKSVDEDDCYASKICVTDDYEKYEVKYALKNSLSVFEDKLDAYLLTHAGSSPSVLTISKLTSTKMTLKFKHAVTDTEMVSFLRYSDKKYNSSTKERFYFSVHSSIKGTGVSMYSGYVKKGTKTLTVKRAFGKKVKKGKTYYYNITDEPNMIFYQKYIKAK